MLSRHSLFVFSRHFIHDLISGKNMLAKTPWAILHPVSSMTFLLSDLMSAFCRFERISICFEG
jgi:hypothetical protein